MYTKSITRNSRALVVLAIDQSTSMAGEITINGRTSTKAEIVAEVANDLIAELVERSRRSEGVRDYYDIALIGYSGRGVNSLLGARRTVSIVELDAACVEECDVEQNYTSEDGSTLYFQQHIRRWIEPLATGETPMFEALLSAHDIVKEWVSKSENRESFPPIIFNITDGESTDGDYSDIANIASKIKSLSTLDGETLLFNIHIASRDSQHSLIFPTADELKNFATPSRSAQSLFESASMLPAKFTEAACRIKGTEYSAEQRAMSLNASVSELITIINIGSISVKRV